MINDAVTFSGFDDLPIIPPQFNIWKQKPPKTDNAWDRLQLINTHLAKIDFLA
jgi:hypothetical protein